MSFDFSTASEITSALQYFSNCSTDYDTYRPTYPPEAIAALLATLSAPQQAVDVGAGTGIGSRLLADQGLTVWAVEPNPQMRMIAPLHDRITYLPCTAASIPLPDHSIDLVTAFQAFHWFDFDHSLREFHRLLQPGGTLGLLWNFWEQRDPVSRVYSQILGAHAQGSPPPVTPQGVYQLMRYQAFWYGCWLPYFRQVKKHRFRVTQVLDQSGILGLARSQGFTPRSGQGWEQLVKDLTSFYQRYQGKNGRVELVYRTYVFTAKPA